MRQVVMKGYCIYTLYEGGKCEICIHVPFRLPCANAIHNCTNMCTDADQRTTITSMGIYSHDNQHSFFMPYKTPSLSQRLLLKLSGIQFIKCLIGGSTRQGQISQCFALLKKKNPKRQHTIAIVSKYHVVMIVHFALIRNEWIIF